MVLPPEGRVDAPRILEDQPLLLRAAPAFDAFRDSIRFGMLGLSTRVPTMGDPVWVCGWWKSRGRYTSTWELKPRLGSREDPLTLLLYTL